MDPRDPVRAAPTGACVAKLPSVQTTLGRMSAIWVNRCGSQDADLGRLGVAVAGRAALEHVGDEDVLAAQADALQQGGEQLAGGADERDARAGPRGSPGASPTNIRSEVGVAVADDHLGAPLAQRAPGAPDDLVAVVGLEGRRPVGGLRHRRQGTARPGRPVRRSRAGMGWREEWRGVTLARTVRVRPGIPSGSWSRDDGERGRPAAAFACPSTRCGSRMPVLPTPTPAAVPGRRPHGGRRCAARWPRCAPRADVSRSCRPWGPSTRATSS